MEIEEEEPMTNTVLGLEEEYQNEEIDLKVPDKVSIDENQELDENNSDIDKKVEKSQSEIKD